jgi:signal transduction histidine kinase
LSSGQHADVSRCGNHRDGDRWRRDQGLREISATCVPRSTLGTQAAIETLVERARSRSGLTIECTVDLAYESGRAGTRQTPALEVGIYRLAQEALSNAVKHAQASRVVIRLSEDDDAVRLRVEDDGHGFDVADQARAGFGLIGMRERVELLGGTLRVTSRATAGTRIDVAVPVQRRSAEASPPKRAIS